MLAGVIAAVAIVFGAKFFSDQNRQDNAIPEQEQAKLVSQLDPIPRQLLFPGTGGKLYGEERQLLPLETTESSIRQLLETLLAGPKSQGLHPLFATEAVSVDVLMTQNARIYVNLISSEMISPPPMGTHQEMLTVFSLVNSIILNFPEIRGVVLLWNGEQNSTFAGHIHTAQPLSIDASLIANPAA